MFKKNNVKKEGIYLITGLTIKALSDIWAVGITYFPSIFPANIIGTFCHMYIHPGLILTVLAGIALIIWNTYSARNTFLILFLSIINGCIIFILPGTIHHGSAAVIVFFLIPQAILWGCIAVISLILGLILFYWKKDY